MDRPVIDAIGIKEAYVLDILEDSVVWVSGAISGRDYADACRDFSEARTWLRQHYAAHVTTPTRLVDPSLPYEQAMRECIHELTKRDYSAADGGLVRRPWYDLAVMLDGWEHSKGARLERSVAEASGILVITLAELKEKAIHEDEMLRVEHPEIWKKKHEGEERGQQA